jgi:hypothetical protein
MAQRTPQPIPLVATGNAKDAQSGAIGQPGTQVKLGNAAVGFRVFSGMRFEIGAWLDPQRIVGIEAGGYVQETRVNHFALASNAAGSPLLAVPFFSRTPGSTGENALVIASPGKTSGSVAVDSSLQRWGTDANVLLCLYRRPGLELIFLTGGRYEDLRESLHLQAQSLTLGTGSSRILDDRFSTRNQFAGVQLGGRVRWQRDVLSLDVTSKIALGATHEVIDIQGASSQTGSKPFVGGLFAQPSNIGRTAANPFTVVPAMEFKLGYQFTPRLRTFVGYDFLYWSQVVRPGDQIDRNVNLSQSPILGTTSGALSGSAFPAPRFQSTSFWGQNVNFGLELSF